jgi:ABC-type transport system involved in multi-copper enzyme maturation permease subunit
MRAAFVAEYRKLVSTRMWWLLLLVMLVYMAFIAAVLGWALTQTDGNGGTSPSTLSTAQIVRTIYTVPVSNGYVFPLIVGALVVTAEYRHKTLTPTLLADPSRNRLVVAKLGVGAVVGVVFGVAGIVVSTGTGAAVLALLGKPTALEAASTWRMLGLAVVALACWALIGVAVGTLITNQVAAVIVLIAFAQFLEPVLRLVLSRPTWGRHIAEYFPGAAGEAITGGNALTGNGVQTLSHWWAGLLVMLGYVVVLALAGRLTTMRRDVD